MAATAAAAAVGQWPLQLQLAPEAQRMVACDGEPYLPASTHVGAAVSVMWIVGVPRRVVDVGAVVPAPVGAPDAVAGQADPGGVRGNQT